MMNQVKVAEILKRLTQEKHIRVKEVALATKIPLSTLHSYMSGKKASYSGGHLIALAEYFGVSTDYLLSGKTRAIESVSDLPTLEVFEGLLHVKILKVVSKK